MNRIAAFSKVSFDEFHRALVENKIMTEEEKDKSALYYEAIRHPVRATEGSAGYDFFIPFAEQINNVKWKTIPTGIRCRISPGWMLVCVPKSGQGFRYRLRLANTVGVIDSDYFYADNQGHIMAKLAAENPLPLKQGDKFMQGIFVPYGITMDDQADGVRHGGLGSTGR